jgi:hypothetical protein
VAPGLLTIITFYSDNNEGACTLSVARLAKFLSRSTTSIKEALARLEQDQIIIVESGKRGGVTNKLTPWVHKAFGEIRDPLTWILDVRAPSATRRPAGRPAKIGSKPADHQFPEIGSKLACHPREIGSKPEPEIGGKPAGYNTTKGNTTEEGNVARASAHARERLWQQPDSDSYSHQRSQARAANRQENELFADNAQHTFGVDSAAPEKRAAELPSQLTERDLNAFNELYNTWGTKPGAILLSKADRAETDEALADELRLHANEDPDVLGSAALAALNSVKAQRSSATGTNGGASMLKLFRKILRTGIDDIRLADANLEAKAIADQAVQKVRLQKRLNGVEQGGQGRNSRMSMQEMMQRAVNRLQEE